jgi:hypothetical protein
MDAEKHNLQPGTRWVSVVDDTEVLVLKGPVGPPVHTLQCGGEPMVPAAVTGSGSLSPTVLSHDNRLRLRRKGGGNAEVTLDGQPLHVSVARYRPLSRRTGA